MHLGTPAREQSSNKMAGSHKKLSTRCLPRHSTLRQFGFVRRQVLHEPGLRLPDILERGRGSTFSTRLPICKLRAISATVGLARMCGAVTSLRQNGPDSPIGLPATLAVHAVRAAARTRVGVACARWRASRRDLNLEEAAGFFLHTHLPAALGVGPQHRRTGPASGIYIAAKADGGRRCIRRLAARAGFDRK